MWVLLVVLVVVVVVLLLLLLVVLLWLVMVSRVGWARVRQRCCRHHRVHGWREHVL